MKLKSLFILSLVVFLFFSWRFVDNGKLTKDSGTASLQVRMREIGHQLLLRTGDSSSRVLPIKKLAANDFQIKFESPLAFVPDTLVNVVRASLSDLNSGSGYVVNVWSCASGEIVYGFEIFGDKQNDVVPCLGRSLPMACYEIRIVFPQPSTLADSRYAYVIVSFLFTLVLAFLVLKKGKNETARKNGSELKFIQLGKIQFFYEKQLLKLGNHDIALTAKENQVFRIFASSPNKTLNRDQLQKEVWENEGVLVGRSLDVFISKLRKKLEAEPAVRIVNIHGKGYKLVIQ